MSDDPGVTETDRLPRPAPAVVRDVVGWYGRNARDLPWRRADASPWAVLVSEFMLQQTPVGRVLPAYHGWLDRWPTPAALAAAAPGEAVRQWGKLGYPRRALRLHAAAQAIATRHAGVVPDRYETLRTLPGVGEYTAAAVAVFAYRRRHAVLDTNVRRVLSRLVSGRQFPPPSCTAGERRLAMSLLPQDPGASARWSVAVMELGALVCAARAPRCGACPVRGDCAWRRAGHPPHDGPPRRAQRYDGTDRQARGRLLGVLRAAALPVEPADLARVWRDAAQRDRALDGLVADGLVERLPDGRYTLP